MSEKPDLANSQEQSRGDTMQPASDILQILRQLNTPQSVMPASASDGIVKTEDVTSTIPPVPQSEWEILRAQLKDKPHDPNGWKRLVSIAEELGDLDKIKDTYEALLAMYPNTVSAQIAYLNHFLNPGFFHFAENLFKRFLRTSPAVELWRFYLTYDRRVNTDPAARYIVRKAYDYALNHVGQDKDSGEIWMEYVRFLISDETNSTWKEQQKVDARRGVYHRAVQIPLENVEALWQELEAFENGLNRITAKKFTNNLSPSYMQARTVLRQLQRHLDPLFPPSPPPSKLYLPPQPTFTQAERALVSAWKTYLRWEESNPLEIKEKDRMTLIARIQGVYRKATIRMRFFSEIWYMAYVWTNSVGKTDEAIDTLKAGIEANPTSFVLNYAYAESLENLQNYAEGHKVYEKFLEALRQGLDALEAKTNSANMSTFTANGVQESSQTTKPGLNNSSSASTTSDDKPPKNNELVERRTEYGVVWIMYMRFAKRAEGLQAARTVFGKARRDSWTPWTVYEASALIEYHSSGETAVATRIMSKGLELFGDNVDFVTRCLSFLLSINDENNARAVFEQAVGTLPVERARPVWELWTRHQYQYGDLASARALEQRMAKVFPNDPPIKRFAQRYIYNQTDAIATRDIGFAITRQAGAQPASNGGSGQPLGRSEIQRSLSANQGPGNGGQPSHPPASSKRPASPDYKRWNDSYGAPSYKRSRPSSPPPGRGRNRWDHGGRCRYGSQDRERERDGPPQCKALRECEEEKSVSLPNVINWFIGALPPPTAFDGPVFRTDDLMQLFRNTVIPSVTGRVRSPPPPPRGGGQAPPDYSPYQGPGGGRRRN